jgi:hypothetical protein
VPSSLLQMWRELEHPRTDAAHPFDREPYPDNADRDHERVRQIARRLTDITAAAATAIAGGEWLGETERQKVRLVREWVQMASQPRDSCVGTRRDEPAAGTDRDRQGEPPRLRGRQARLDVISRMARERQCELQDGDCGVFAAGIAGERA